MKDTFQTLLLFWLAHSQQIPQNTSDLLQHLLKLQDGTLLGVLFVLKVNFRHEHLGSQFEYQIDLFSMAQETFLGRVSTRGIKVRWQQFETREFVYRSKGSSFFVILFRANFIFLFFCWFIPVRGKWKGTRFDCRIHRRVSVWNGRIEKRGVIVCTVHGRNRETWRNRSGGDRTKVD